ncbi:PepSY-like domain-containing protein [Dysgonomonas macrotermitis]|uniref:Putative beta-lactamase-inhibitor-like, PepSY-like n=1 Tax=Dysgonomonas macrotermitis TaxID=1346286 RepID=A0A1M4ZVW6_9BACT|nr:PepSY-like domain-containing protein [Dysgonomonas macrotermitis]SHF21967.1 Putative beta-lactamase-inhibitor-like, PepSY-like [Dysgonomonas macrotermitis]
MKKFSLIAICLLVAFTSSAFNLSNDRYVPASELPKNGKTLISTYFKDQNILTVEKDWSEYEVILNNGVKIEFDSKGQWKDIDSNHTTLPRDILNLLPKKAIGYINQNYADWQISEIKKERYGYQIELVNAGGDIDLKFNSKGEIVKVDY